jgi:hypothetical protein
VTHFIALKAQLLIAFKRVMGVFAAKNAIHSASLIRTFPRKVPKFFAVPTLYGRVCIVKVPRDLVLEF